LTITFCC
jgi:hypothetical protein